MIDARLTLISSSPRRRELLKRLDNRFDVCPSHAAETWRSVDPEELAVVNARKKVEQSSLFGDPTRLLIGADTIVVLGKRVFGKPFGAQSARRFLCALSDQWHSVITGVCIAGPKNGDVITPLVVTGTCKTRIRFKRLTEHDISVYMNDGEWAGKAGAYAIQGRGGEFVQEIDGDYDNVVGLPVQLTRSLIEKNFPYIRFC